MKMKKRIFISNTIMVLLSLLILFAVGGVYIKLFKNQIMDVIKQNAEISDNIYEVQTMLKEQQKEPDTWEILSSKLEKYQFELYVSDLKNNKVYSNVPHSAMECIEKLEKDDFESDIIKIYGMERVTIAKCIIMANDNEYMVYAVCPENKQLFWGIDGGMLEIFIVVFIIAGIIVIAALLLCCLIFTKHMIKRIMQPVDELNRAAKRIKEGNLDEPVDYNIDDEFGEVCNTFNEMQKKLKEGMEKNAKYEKARTEMISGISHDLRTPLTSVKGFIKGMIDGVANTPEKMEQYLKISYKKACDMEVLLQKLFFFSKLETGNMPFYLQKIEINKWLKNYVNERQMEGNEKNFKINITTKNEDCCINADFEQLKRVFDNLIENSRKYAQTEQLEISISIKKINDKVHIYIADNGMGVSEDKLPHIFEQFYRGDESRNSKNDGSGLGLYVCKYIIEQQGGTISAYNNNGLVVEIAMPNLDI